jgi:hypothetical protein
MPEKIDLKEKKAVFWFTVSVVSVHVQLVPLFGRTEVRQSITAARTCGRGCSMTRKQKERERGKDREEEGGKGRLQGQYIPFKGHMPSDLLPPILPCLLKFLLLPSSTLSFESINGLIH